MKLTTRILVIGILAVFLLSGFAFAQGCPSGQPCSPCSSGGGKAKMGPGCGPGGMFPQHAIMGSFLLHPELAKALGLDKAQVEKLEAMRTEHQKKGIDAMAAVLKMKVDLKSMMEGPDFNIPAIQKMLQQVSDANVKMQVSRLQAFEEAKAVLTAEQKKKLQEIWKNPSSVMGKKGMKQGAGGCKGGMEPPPGGPGDGGPMGDPMGNEQENSTTSK